jgi:menaquinone-specific isochorismate synthase
VSAPLHACSWRVDADLDPLDVAGPEGTVWEDGQHGTWISGRGVAATVTLPGGIAAGVAPLEDALAGITQHGDPAAPPPVALAALPFRPDATGRALIPALTVRRLSDGTRWATAIGPNPANLGADDHLVHPEAGTAPTPPSCYRIDVLDDRDGHTAAVAAAVAAIARGEVRKVVLVRAVDVRADQPFDTSAALRRLRATFPTCLRYRIDGFIGASPELLVARSNDLVTATPLAGTVPRLGDPVADAQLAAKLLASRKDRVEHHITIDRLHDALLPFCSYLDSEAEPHVLSVANVQHLASTVEGRLSHPLPSVAALVAAVHPTPALGGDPTEAALALIAALERHDRGAYGGPIGWMDGAGNGAFAVGVRSAAVSGAQARLFAGGGIVAESDPEAEYVETQPKLLTMLNALIRP